ncbi:MAG: aminotransferase class I/II-fold pyridoxal phosphate-dependent enzyme [Spirochaetes bacterium]|nr:aminotransferase class I/II-fold pyridoxal phosphate-dependent enzyme [Spirochaetota bacterium]
MVLPFDVAARKRYYALLDEVFDASFWSDGPKLKQFEESFSVYCGLHAKGISNGGVGLLSILDYINIKGMDVVVPSNTFWATAQAVKKAGGTVVYADCNKEDLCLSYTDLQKRITPKTKAVIVVHIGGHIAFEIEKIAAFCKSKKIILVEDCAHAHGAELNGKMGGSWGFAGAYSFYATKTMPMGEGGMVVSTDKGFIDWVGKYRNYGKEVVDGKVTYPILDGFNYRMNEFTAALGIVQLERLPAILEWKRELAAKYDAIFNRRVVFSPNMKSGYYKYITFDYKLKEKSGGVYGMSDLCHVIEGRKEELPNTMWVAEHHQCPPIFHGWEKAGLKISELSKTLL